MPKRYTYRKATAEELASGFPEMIEILVEDLPDGMTIKQAKQEKFGLIDAKTQELIFQGFAFAGLHWSLSINAQINWTNLPTMPEFAFPLNMQDMDGTDYVLSYEERMNFYDAAMAAKNTHLQSGNALKTQVSELTNIEEILNFVDPR